jgi:hypothetical protein
MARETTCISERHVNARDFARQIQRLHTDFQHSTLLGTCGQDFALARSEYRLLTTVAYEIFRSSTQLVQGY